jgi:hypothetical protein
LPWNWILGLSCVGSGRRVSPLFHHCSVNQQECQPAERDAPLLDAVRDGTRHAIGAYLSDTATHVAGRSLRHHRLVLAPKSLSEARANLRLSFSNRSLFPSLVTVLDRFVACRRRENSLLRYLIVLESFLLSFAGDVRVFRRRLNELSARFSVDVLDPVDAPGAAPQGLLLQLLGLDRPVT